LGTSGEVHFEKNSSAAHPNQQSIPQSSRTVKQITYYVKKKPLAKTIIKPEM
jgi:hypothetical protein